MVSALASTLGAADLPPAGPHDWPQFRGPNRDGISTEVGWTAAWPPEGPKLIWKARVGTGYASIAVARGRAYTAGNEADRDTVYCFDTVTGAAVWTHVCECPLLPDNHAGGPGATPTIDVDRVYTLSKVGRLLCLDAASGKAVWEKDLAKDPGVKRSRWGFQGSPMVVGERLYLNAGAAGLCLEKATGKTLWASDPEGAGYSTPVFRRTGDRLMMVLMTEKAVRGVDAADGKALWVYDWPTAYGENVADPIWIGDRLFISASQGMGAALLDVSGAAPKSVWKNAEHGTHIATSVFWRDHLYGFDGLVYEKEGQALNCIDAKTGETRWRKDGLFGSILVADGTLVMTLVDGRLIAAEASPAGYKELARAQVLGGRCWTMPTLANGRIYCRNDAGEVICLDVKKP